jgi:hypothetical protein
MLSWDGSADFESCRATLQQKAPNSSHYEPARHFVDGRSPRTDWPLDRGGRSSRRRRLPSAPRRDPNATSSPGRLRLAGRVPGLAPSSRACFSAASRLFRNARALERLRPPSFASWGATSTSFGPSYGGEADTSARADKELSSSFGGCTRARATSADRETALPPETQLNTDARCLQSFAPCASAFRRARRRRGPRPRRTALRAPAVAHGAHLGKLRSRP